MTTRKTRPVKAKALPAGLRRRLEEGMKSGEVTGLEPKACRAILAALEYERQAVVALLRAGTPLANAAFNLRQMPHLTGTEKTALEAAQKNWDAAVARNRR